MLSLADIQRGLKYFLAINVDQVVLTCCRAGPSQQD